MEVDRRVKVEVMDGGRLATGSKTRFVWIEDQVNNFFESTGSMTRMFLHNLATRPCNLGVLYLCNFVDGRKVKMLEVLQEQLKVSRKPRGYLNSSEPPSLMGLKEIADSLVSGNANRLISDGTMQEGIERLDDWPRTLMRTASTKC